MALSAHKLPAPRSYRSAITELPTELLLVDHTYQRPLNLTKIKKIAAMFNPNLLGVLVVNQRDPEVGRYYVVDGQSRLSAVNLLHDWPMTIRCELFVGLTLAEESWLYHELDTRRQSLNPYDSYVSALVAGDPEAMGIESAVRTAGMEVHRGPGAGHVRAITALYGVYRRDGATVLTRALRILSRAWPDETDGAPYPLIDAIGALLAREPTLDEKRLATVLRKQSPQATVARARALSQTMSSSTQAGAIMALAGLYNVRLSEDKRIATSYYSPAFHGNQALLTMAKGK